MWFFKPSSSQLKFHVEALGESSRKGNFQPEPLLHQPQAQTSHPPRGGIFSRQMFLMLLQIQKLFVRSFPKRGDPSLPGGDAQPSHSSSPNPTVPDPRATHSRHLLERLEHFVQLARGVGPRGLVSPPKNPQPVLHVFGSRRKSKF